VHLAIATFGIGSKGSQASPLIGAAYTAFASVWQSLQARHPTRQGKLSAAKIATTRFRLRRARHKQGACVSNSKATDWIKGAAE